jgi:hypothetical protein
MIPQPFATKVTDSSIETEFASGSHQLCVGHERTFIARRIFKMMWYHAAPIAQRIPSSASDSAIKDFPTTDTVV